MIRTLKKLLGTWRSWKRVMKGTVIGMGREREDDLLCRMVRPLLRP